MCLYVCVSVGAKTKEETTDHKLIEQSRNVCYGEAEK